MFSEAIDALTSALNAVAAELVTYTTAGGSAASILATHGRSTISVQDTDGAVMQVLSHDWIVAADDLAVLGSGGNYTPQKGDTITTGQASQPNPGGIFPAAQVFELMAPPYSPSDHAGRRLRLHSVRIN